MDAPKSISKFPLHQLANIVTLKLKEDNFLTRKSLFLALLAKFRATDYITGLAVCPPQRLNHEINPAYLLWKDEDSTITLLLYSTMSESVVPYFAGASSGFVLWTNIQTRFSQVSATHTIHLRTKLQSIRLGNGSITDYLSEIKKVVDALAAAGSIVSDIRVRYPPVTSVELHNLLLSEEIVLATRSKSILADTENKAFLVHNNSRSFHSHSHPSTYPFRGYNPGMRGGHSPNYKGKRPFNPAYRGYSPSSSFHHPAPTFASVPPPSSMIPDAKIPCQICGDADHLAPECSHRLNFAYQGKSPPQNLHAMLAAANIFGGNPWYADSGANNHIVNNNSLLDDYTTYDGYEYIQTANGEGSSNWEDSAAGSSCQWTVSNQLQPSTLSPAHQ